MTAEEGSWRWKLALLTVVGGLTLFALAGRDRYAPLDVGSRAPEYAAPTLDNDSVSVRDLRGSVVLINVWATWCPPCLREMPALQRLHEALAPDGLRILAVNVDNDMFGADPVELVQTFVDGMGLTFDILLDPENRIESTYQIAGLPMTFVIDRRGRIRQKKLGAREWDSPDAVAEIRSLLEN